MNYIIGYINYKKALKFKKLQKIIGYIYFKIKVIRIDENKLTTIYKVINTGITNMPFGIGGHPAFKIDIEQLKKGNYYLEFEEKEEKLHFLYLVDGLIGKTY